jgi:hypothetical protein
MTNYSRDDSPYGRKHSTELHLVYRIEDGELVSLGLFETRETAEQEIEFLSGWKIADLGCSGWGTIDGVVHRNQLPRIAQEKAPSPSPAANAAQQGDWKC